MEKRRLSSKKLISMNKNYWEKYLKHVAAYIIFFIISFILCSPVLKGYVLQQGDTVQWYGMIKDAGNYQAKHDGKMPLWTNNIFGGMPIFALTVPGNGINIGALAYLNFSYISNFLIAGNWLPASFFVLLCIGFYFLAQIMGFDYKISILGSLAYAYCSNSSILVVAGHHTKVWIMGFIPFMIAGMWLICVHRKYILGACIFAIFLSFMFGQRHVQIIYYSFILVLFMAIYFLIDWLKKKEYKHLILSGTSLIIAGLFAYSINSVTLQSMNDYAKSTMRGGSALLEEKSQNNKSKNENKGNDGLQIDYAYNWSYGILETFTFILPNVQGGGSSTPIPENSKFYEELIGSGLNQQQAVSLAQQLPMYWGDQPFTSGPIYMGIIIIFLCIYGMFYLKTNHKWWMFAFIVISVIMSWGKNFPLINDFLFYNLPYYNKFRTPSQIFSLTQLVFPLLACLFLKDFVTNKNDYSYKIICFKKSLYVVGGIIFLLVLVYFNANFSSINEKQLLPYLNQMLNGNNEQAKSIIGGLKEDRQTIFMSDFLRMILLLLITVALLWYYIKQKLSANTFVIIMLFFVAFDLIQLDYRYINPEMFQEKETAGENNFLPTEIDRQILADTTNPRVLDLSRDVFNDATTCYFHRAVGGYSPAKLSIYEDLLNFQLRRKTNIKVLSMLNCKYIIQKNDQGQPILSQNPEALTYSWLVPKLQFKKTALEVINQLDSFEPQQTAILYSSDSASIKNIYPQLSASDYIKQIKNDNDEIFYEADLKNTEFAVFSEIFYTRPGWKAYIDDQETPIYQTNYVLRGIVVPPGFHKIKFEFRPPVFYKYAALTTFSNLFLALSFISILIYEFLKRRKDISNIQTEPIKQINKDLPKKPQPKKMK